MGWDGSGCQNLKDDLDQYLNKLKSETANTKEKAELKRLKTDSEIADDRIKEVITEIKNLEEEFLKKENELEKKEKAQHNTSVRNAEEKSKEIPNKLVPNFVENKTIHNDEDAINKSNTTVIISYVVI